MKNRLQKRKEQLANEFAFNYATIENYNDTIHSKWMFVKLSIIDLLLTLIDKLCTN